MSTSSVTTKEDACDQTSTDGSTSSNEQGDAKRQRLCSEDMKEFIVTAFSMVDNPSKELWEKLPDYWKKDTDIVLAASQSRADEGTVSWDQIPDDLQRNEGIVRAILHLLEEGNASQTVSWDQIPVNLQNNESFVRAILHLLGAQDNDFHSVNAKYPHLFQEHDVWRRLVDQWRDEEHNGTYLEIADRVGGFAPEAVKMDRKIMLKAIIIEHEVWPHAHISLRRDETFVRYSLQIHPMVLESMTQDEARMFREVIMASLGSIRDWNKHCMAAEELPEEFWQDRDFVVAWFQAGLPYVDMSRQPDAFKTDEEIFLLISSHCIDRHKMDCFQYVSPVLRASKDFMMKAIHNDARLFRFATDELKKDFDIVLLALGGYPDEHVADFPTDFSPFYRQCVQKIGAGLDAHAPFVKTILCGMSLDANCSLYLLNQGKLTSEAYKKSIASYLGVPATGTDLRLYRQAYAKFSQRFT